MTGPVVPVAVVAALASDLRKSAKGIRRATGDHQDGQEYEAAADRLDALVAEHQTDAPPNHLLDEEVRLTDEERESLRRTMEHGDWCDICDGPQWVDERGEHLCMALVPAVEAIVASHTEPLRAEVERLDAAEVKARVEAHKLRETATYCHEVALRHQADADQARAEVEQLRRTVGRYKGDRDDAWAALENGTDAPGATNAAALDLAALRERVTALHRPIRVYDECEHDEDHGCEPIEVYDYMGCSESVIGWACETCCYDDEYPLETCPHGADHLGVTEAESCPTLAALSSPSPDAEGGEG